MILCKKNSCPSVAVVTAEVFHIVDDNHEFKYLCISNISIDNNPLPFMITMYEQLKHDTMLLYHHDCE